MSKSNELTPKIYVACLAAYNNGTLHGCWIDAAQEVEEMREDIHRMLAASPEPSAEEYAIHDYENFAGLKLSEWEGLEGVRAYALFLQEHGELGARLLEHFGNDLQEAERAQENYAGCYASLADFAEELTQETSEVPQHLARYIDYEAMGRDMEMSGDLITLQTGWDELHIFWSH